MNTFRNDLEDIVLIIPSLNPDEKLTRTLAGMLEAGFSHVVLVDDGSDDAHKAPFEEARLHPECVILEHGVNRGKGAALKTSFAYIAEHYPNAVGVVTVDGDAQHLPEDARKVALRMKEVPGTMVIGCRNFAKAGVPMHNRLGNWITSFAFKLLCGIRLSDTQTGLRGIPASCLKPFLDVDGDRFEYETNMLLKMKELQIPFVEQEIQTVYIEGNTSSHFNPVRDSIRIYLPILKFGGSSIIATIVDLTLFKIMTHVFANFPNAQQIFFATAIARVVSSLLNFTLTRRAVFKSKAPAQQSLVRYYSVAVVQMLASYLLVLFFNFLLGRFGIGKTVIKAFVDFFLFFLTFQIQREWVFKEDKKAKRNA